MSMLSVPPKDSSPRLSANGVIGTIGPSGTGEISKTTIKKGTSDKLVP